MSAKTMLCVEEEPSSGLACPSSIQLYLNEINEISRLSHEEERELALCVRAGDKQAKQRFILANLRLVVAVAKGYSTSDLDLLDHIQNGYFGLVRAVERFDPITYKVCFSTYAMFWIRRAIVREQADTARSVRLPSYIQDELRMMERAADAWMAEHETEASDDHLAACLGVDVAHVSLLRRSREWTLSLDYPVDNQDGDDELTRGDCLADPEVEQSYTWVGECQVREGLSGLVEEAMQNCLTVQEHRVVSLYFGLSGGEEMMRYAAIGREIGVSRTRARTVLLGALPKLRAALRGVYREMY